MKKIIKIVLVLFVTLTLGACGSSEEKDTNKPTKTEEKKEEKIYSGYAWSVHAWQCIIRLWFCGKSNAVYEGCR